MKTGVITFPGSNCDYDLIYVLRDIMGLEVEHLWHKTPDLHGCDVIFVPGGFSYGDYLRAGAIARFSPIMPEVVKHADKGGIVVGICNGFQILTEANLLPGALLMNDIGHFVCDNVYVRPATTDTRLTQGLDTTRAYKLPIAHAEGKYYADADTISRLEDNDQILFYYTDENGTATSLANPNGSVKNIAGVCNISRNVFGFMPHPERAAEPALANTDGAELFASLFEKTALAI
ncbi:MAG: phosphoribosylformylglycinamidine synthase subunit PurQ [Bacteroidota bacterium]